MAVGHAATIRAMKRVSLLPALALAGCLTHLPPVSQKHLDIHWAASFDAAQVRAVAERKPLLVCLVAGEIAGPC
jgi:hypothetical protein